VVLWDNSTFLTQALELLFVRSADHPRDVNSINTWCSPPERVFRTLTTDETLRRWGCADNKSGNDKASILNVGSSHQYRLARQLPEEWSNYHIEQP
jgi:hypothetical protein